ncbi:caspase, EACC1-associated type [Streptomyces pini]|uniref:caspase, EACC1-associated type n=1 Tax=Streptomyces pini TaxID=1520580 RepID=UPI000B81B259|nr:caspase family protein [Streptomyces pini]
MSGRTSLPELPPGRRSALVVAVSAYADAGLARLRAPARDAEALAEVLGAPDIGGFDVRGLTDPTAQEIRSGVDDFLSGRGTDELLLVYFSCHGLLDARGRLYFAGADTRKGRLASTGVESGWLLEQLDECRARRQVVILDCCFSGAFAQGAKSGERDVDLESRIVGHGRGRAVLTASRSREYSFEGESLTGTADPEGSVFTTGLVDGLRTGAADADGDGYISVEDAFDHASAYVAERGAEQTPQRWVFGGEGRIWLARAATTPATTGAAKLWWPIQRRRRSRRPHPAGGRPIALRATAGPAPTPAPASPPAPTSAPTPVPTPTAASVRDHVFRTRGRTRSDPLHALPVWGTSGIPEQERRVTAMTIRSGVSIPLVAISVDGGPPQVWEAVQGRHVSTLPGLDGEVRTITYGPNGDFLAISSDDGSIRLWDETRKRPRVLADGEATLATRIAIAPGSRRLAADGADGSIVVWDTFTGQVERSIGKDSQGRDPLITALAFSPDGFTLAMGTSTGVVRVVDTHSGKQVARVQCHESEVAGLTFRPDGQRLVSAGGADGSVVLWDTRKWRKPRYLFLVGSGHVGRVAFSPDGELLGVGAGSGVHLLDPDTGGQLAALGQGSGEATDVFAFPHSHLLATAGTNGEVSFWDPRTARRLYLMTGGHRTKPEALGFLPSGRHLITAGRDGVYVWQFQFGGRAVAYVWELL